ncbi:MULTISPECIES: hypothetical protein [unclassified Okeania]|nr:MULTISPECIES: hypothetical protein [unclassified Okeania]
MPTEPELNLPPVISIVSTASRVMSPPLPRKEPEFEFMALNSDE